MATHSKCKWCGNTFEKGGWNSFVSHNTFGIGGKESYCSEKCRMEATGQQQSSGKSMVKGVVTGALGAGISVAQKGWFGAAMDAMDSSSNKQQQMAYVEEDRLDGKIGSIAELKFSSDVDSLTNELNQLVTIGSGAKTKEIRKAIYEKMEFGVIKLRGLGATTEADFFEKKRQDIKPKWHEGLL